MRNNKITSINNIQYWELPKIYDIDFSLNSIQVLPPINLPSLAILKLSNNNITNIEALEKSNL